MKSFTKKTIVLALLTIGVMVSSLAIAANDVTNSKHNFSASGGGSWTELGINQVCVFCHTPHNAGQTRALWNKAGLNTATNFRLYTSSGSLTSVTKASSLPAGSPSLLCLSCHDGKTAMNVMHTSGTGAAAPTTGPNAYPVGSRYAEGFDPEIIRNSLPDGWGGIKPTMNLGSTAGTENAAGDDLTNDHPIGFSYDDVLSLENVGGLKLHPRASAVAAGIRFFGPSNRVECSSCHNPHAYYSDTDSPELKPFLVKSNSGSALCLACHNK